VQSVGATGKELVSMVTTQTHWRTISLACAAAMFLCMALGRFSFSTMIPALVEADAITDVQGGYIGGLNLCGFFLGAALAVQLTNAFGMRQVILLSVWAATLSLFACVISVGIYWLGFWRFVERFDHVGLDGRRCCRIAGSSFRHCGCFRNVARTADKYFSGATVAPSCSTATATTGTTIGTITGTITGAITGTAAVTGLVSTRCSQCLVFIWHRTAHHLLVCFYCPGPRFWR